jgi:signal transduction histidine kinase
MASHEFNTPLTTILSSVQLLKIYINQESDGKRDKHIARIISSVNHLTEILNDFLTVGKMQEGDISFNPTTFNIKEHITTIITEFKNDQSREQLISYEHNGKELVDLDAVLLKKITLNILSNAIKFSTKKMKIEIKTEWINGRVILSIKDYGIGIPPEYSRHLFEQFYRASNAINIQGTGLGLHMVSKYVDLMNGNIHYKSELDKGTEFVISFWQIND